MAGAIAIGKGLASNTSLLSLILSDNDIEEEGGYAIAAGLEGNSSLTTLDLSVRRPTSFPFLQSTVLIKNR